jgi:hypothetical protein
MARTVRNQKLDTRSARAKLPVRSAIYWVSLAPGCALGYRKGPKGGVWIAKIVRGGLRHQTALGPADDVLDPDGRLAISYVDAQGRAREWFEEVMQPAAPAGPYTVADSVADYLGWFKATGRKSIKETEASVGAFILPQLGAEEIRSLTAARLRQWHADIAASAPRLRTRLGRQPNLRDTSDDPEASRRRRASANRILTVLKAAFNHGWREGKVPSDQGMAEGGAIPRSRCCTSALSRSRRAPPAGQRQSGGLAGCAVDRCQILRIGPHERPRLSPRQRSLLVRTSKA